MTDETQDNPDSPLRRAVKTCLHYKAPWKAETVAEIAGCDVKAAKGFCSRLFNTEVLAKTIHGTYVAGVRAQAWLDMRPKTHPGGRSKRYQQARKVRDELAVQEWVAGREGDETAELQRGDGIQMVEEIIEEGSLTIKDVCSRLKVHRSTVHVWIKSGRLKAVRLPNGQYRTTKAAVDEIMEVVDGS